MLNYASRPVSRAAFAALLVALLPSIPAQAQSPTIDGTRDSAFYGAAKSVQTAQTNFGDANTGATDTANGSELDAAYGRISNGRLYLFFAGNLESNFNKLDIFIDNGSGQGQNTLRGDNADVDFNGLNRMGAGNNQPGLTFDAGFNATQYLTVGGGNSPYQLFANFATLPTNGGGSGFYLGSTGAASNGTFSGGASGAPDILGTINNSNTAGVTGGTGAADQVAAAAVNTGVEFSISLDALGSPSGDIKVSAFVNGGGHDFLSNQVLGGIGTGDNLGEPRNVNFANTTGSQFFTVSPVPAPPGAISLLLGAAVTALPTLRRRRRQPVA